MLFTMHEDRASIIDRFCQIYIHKCICRIGGEGREGGGGGERKGRVKWKKGKRDVKEKEGKGVGEKKRSREGKQVKERMEGKERKYVKV